MTDLPSSCSPNSHCLRFNYLLNSLKFIKPSQMREASSFHTSHNLGVRPNQQYSQHRFHSLGCLRDQISSPFSQLIPILQSLIQGTRCPSELFATDRQPQLLRKESSIEDLAKLYNEQPVENGIPSITILSSQFSFRQWELDEAPLGSRLSCYSLASLDDAEDFNCASGLKENDLASIFSEEDFKIMAMALSLLCKYLHITGRRLTEGNMTALFFTSAVVGFKLAYDNALPGLISEVSKHLQVQPALLQRLERCFLRAIDYDLNVSGRPLRTVMAWFI